AVGAASRGGRWWVVGKIKRTKGALVTSGAKAPVLMAWRNAGLKACSTQANLRPAPPKPISVKPGLFFFFLFFFRLGLGFAAGFGGFLHVFGATGASFSALLALLRLDLLRAQQLDEDFFRAIAALVALTDDAQISAFAVAEARRDGIEEPRNRLARH